MRVIVVGDSGTKDAVIAAPFTDPSTPILFVKKDEIPGSVRDELRRLLPTEILVFGGTARVSDAIVAVLGQLAPVTRIAGASVFSTAIQASQTLHPIEPPIEPPIDPPADAVIIPAGVHSGYTVAALPGVTYWGEPGAVLDGNGDTRSTYTGSADGVTIDNVEIRNYTNPNQTGAIHLTGNDLTVKRCDIHHNLGVGVKLDYSDRSRILDCNIHHQHQLGISLRGVGGLVEGNEIAFNNWLKEVSWGWEAGGTKFWSTTDLTVRDNYSHDNHGPGLWTDFNHTGTLYEDNRVEDNAGPGIFHEISYSAVIRNNQIRRNGEDGGWLWNAGIQVASSQDVEIYGNVLEGNWNGVSLSQQNRGSGNQGEWLTRNCTVHDNTVDGGKSGVVQDVGSDGVFNANNRWYGNTYDSGHRFAWNNQWGDSDWWRQYHPQDGV